MRIRKMLGIVAATGLLAAAALGSAYAAKAAPSGTPAKPVSVAPTAQAGGGEMVDRREAEPETTAAEPAETAEPKEKAAEGTESAEQDGKAGDTDNVQHEAQGEETGDNGSANAGN